jgi:hypothetical protein
MNILKIIEELREERACLDEVLIGLEKFRLSEHPEEAGPHHGAEWPVSPHRRTAMA